MLAAALGLSCALSTAAAAEPLPRPPTPSVDAHAVRRALTPLDDVFLVPAATHPEASPRIFGATLLPGVRPEQVGAVLLDPRALRAALPALIRAEVVRAVRSKVAPFATPGTSPPAPPVEARLLAWEIEIPFFNLSGRAWLSQRGDAVDFQLTEGAFSPGFLRFRVTPDPQTRGTVVTCESQLSFASSNFLLRRLARHDPWAPTAMASAIAWVALRAIASRAGVGPDAPLQRPTGTPGAPAGAIRGDDLLAPELAQLRAQGTVLRVRRRADGRLAFVSAVAVNPRSAAETRRRLSAPESWTAFPGWKTVTRRPTDPTLFDVTDDIAFVDFDSTWRLDNGDGSDGHLPLSARAVGGRIHGAALAWDFGPDAAPALVLSMNPRLDTAGFIERRMIAAEPLLEHGLALGLVYTDLAGAVAALASEPSARPSR